MPTMNGHQETKTNLTDLINKRFTIQDHHCEYFPPTLAERRKNLHRVQYNIQFKKAYAIPRRKPSHGKTPE